MTNAVTGNQPATLPGATGTTTAPATTAATTAATAATTPTTGTGATTGTTSGTVDTKAEDARLDRVIGTQYNVLAAMTAQPGQNSLTSGISILSKIYSVRSSRLADISLALANYTNATGQLNQAAVVKLQQENDANSNLNQLIKSLFDKQADAIRAWMQLR